MAKNCPKCCQIAKIFVLITSWKSIVMALENPRKLGEFFLLLCGHPASFHFCHWNQFKVIALACTLHTRNLLQIFQALDAS